MSTAVQEDAGAEQLNTLMAV